MVCLYTTIDKSTEQLQTSPHVQSHYWPFQIKMLRSWASIFPCLKFKCINATEVLNQVTLYLLSWNWNSYPQCTKVKSKPSPTSKPKRESEVLTVPSRIGQKLRITVKGSFYLNQDHFPSSFPIILACVFGCKAILIKHYGLLELKFPFGNHITNGFQWWGFSNLFGLEVLSRKQECLTNWKLDLKAMHSISWNPQDK